MAKTTKSAAEEAREAFEAYRARAKNLEIKPLFNNVLIKPIEAEEKTSGGIYLPETAKEKPQIGLIMAVCEGEVTPKGEVRKMTVKVGQKVMYKKWGGNEIKVGNEEWTIVEEKDILAIVS